MKTTENLEKAKRTKAILKTKTKKELTARLNTGIVYSTSDSPKSWLIYDILLAEFGKEIADKIG